LITNPRKTISAASELPFIDDAYLEPYFTHVAPSRGESRWDVMVEGGHATLTRRSVAGVRIAELAGRGSADYSDISYDSDAGGKALLKAIVEDADNDVVVLRNLRGGSPTVAFTLAMAESEGWQYVSQRVSDQAPYLMLEGTWDELYAQLRDRKSRYNLRRSASQLATLGEVEIVDYTTTGDVDAHLGEAFELYARRPRGIDAPWRFSGPIGQRMYRDMAARLCAVDAMSLAFLRVDDRPAAFTYGIRYGRAYYYYLVGITDDPAIGKLSPGTLLLEHLIKDSLERGLERFDLMLGMESYKTAWASGAEDVLSIVLTRGGLRSRAAGLAYLGASGAREWARRSSLARGVITRVLGMRRRA
jgi:CelD/BcsL family acetyltransferase involved in cellulose biosynthesis